MKHKSVYATLVCILGLPVAAKVEAQQAGGWTMDVVWTYEVKARRSLAPRPDRGPYSGEQPIGGSAALAAALELRGTVVYTNDIQGAVVPNSPDGRDDRRYDSWRSDEAGSIEKLSMRQEAQFDRAIKLNMSETDASANKRNAGRFGRVLHDRVRVEATTEDPAVIAFRGGDLQLDRATNTLYVGRLEIQRRDSDSLLPRRQSVERLDRPARQGDWDSSGPGTAQDWRLLPEFHLVDLVFDVPAGAEDFTVTRTRVTGDVEDPFERYSGWRSEDGLASRDLEARETVTLTLRRIKAAQPASGAPAAQGDAAGNSSRDRAAQDVPKRETGKQTPSAVDQAAEEVKKRLRRVLPF
jgi:hypothetical protein